MRRDTCQHPVEWELTPRGKVGREQNKRTSYPIKAPGARVPVHQRVTGVNGRAPPHRAAVRPWGQQDFLQLGVGTGLGPGAGRHGVGGQRQKGVDLGGLRRLWGCRREVRQNYKNYKQVQWPAHSKPSSKVCCTKGADFGLMLEPTVT